MTNDFSAFPIYLKTLDALANCPWHAAFAFADLCGLTVSEIPVGDLRPFRNSLFWHRRNDGDAGHVWLRELIVATMEELDEQVSARTSGS